MELMIVLAFLLALFVSGVHTKTAQWSAKSSRLMYNKWMKSVTDKEFEERLIRVFEKKNVTREDEPLIEELRQIKDDNPECVSGFRELHYKAKDWDIPIMLAVRGKIPSYQLKSGQFERKDNDVYHLRLFKWCESQLKQHGLHVNLYATGLCGANPRLITDVNEVKTSLLRWIGEDEYGQQIKWI